MRQGLEAYLAEFAGGLTETPSRFASTPSYSTPAPVVTTPVVAAATVRSADALVAAHVLPARLPPGTTVFNVPVLVPALDLSTPDAWTSEMTSVRTEVEAIMREATRRLSTGTAKTARGERPDAHILNNYRWTEYPIPSNGDCAPANQVWLDLWFRCKAALARMSFAPPPGTDGTAVARWGQDVEDAISLLFDSSNIRHTSWGSAPDSNPFAPGLASSNQGRGLYTPQRRADGTENTPQPTGGWRELMGRDLPQPVRVWTCSDTRSNPYGPPCLPPSELTAVGPYTPRWVYSYGRGAGSFSQWNGMSRSGAYGSPWPAAADIRALVRTYWNRRGVFATPAYGPGALLTYDIGAWINSTATRAGFFADARLSYPAVMLRTVGFYQRTYLKVWAERGVVPQDVADNARAAWESATASERGLVTGLVGSAGGAVTAIATAINPIAGAVVGAVVLVASLITQFSDAISAPDREVPEPMALRFYAGTCNDAAWAPTPPPLVSAPRTTRPTSTIVTDPTPPPPPEEDRDPAKGPAGLVIGVGSLAFGLWLLSRSTR